MPVWVLSVLGTVGGTLAKMAMSLMTETFIKRITVQGLEVVVKRTATDEDDKLLKAARETWGI